MRRFRQLGILTAGVFLIAQSFTFAGEAPKATDKKTVQSADKSAKPASDEIVWLRYDEAIKKAREENKHVFVDFTATWCGWCKRLDRDTFSQPEVKEMLSKNFVTARVWDHEKEMLDIDGYKVAEKDLGRTQFGVSSYPTLWFISPDGQKIGPIKGYVNAEQFMIALNFVKDYKYLVASTDEEGSEEKTEQ